MQDYYMYPTEEGLTREERISQRQMYLTDRQVKCLSGKPSKVAENLSAYWEGCKPEIPHTARDLSNFYRQKVNDCITKIANLHGITFHTPDNSEQDRKSFVVSVSYMGKNGTEETFISSCMDSEKFKSVFRDLDFLRLSPVMHYKHENDRVTHISYVSLGNIRKYDFSNMGIKDNTEEELVLAGLDNESNKDFLELRTDIPYCDEKRHGNIFSRIEPGSSLSSRDDVLYRKTINSLPDDSMILRVAEKLIEPTDDGFRFREFSEGSVAVNVRRIIKESMEELGISNTFLLASPELSDCYCKFRQKEIWDRTVASAYDEAFRKVSAIEGLSPEKNPNVKRNHLDFEQLKHIDSGIAKMMLSDGFSKKAVTDAIIADSPACFMLYNGDGKNLRYAKDVVRKAQNKNKSKSSSR